jgi:hypothetical protein
MSIVAFSGLLILTPLVFFCVGYFFPVLALKGRHGPAAEGATERRTAIRCC